MKIRGKHQTDSPPDPGIRHMALFSSYPSKVIAESRRLGQNFRVERLSSSSPFKWLFYVVD